MRSVVAMLFLLLSASVTYGKNEDRFVVSFINKCVGTILHLDRADVAVKKAKLNEWGFKGEESQETDNLKAVFSHGESDSEENADPNEKGVVCSMYDPLAEPEIVFSVLKKQLSPKRFYEEKTNRVKMRQWEMGLEKETMLINMSQNAPPKKRGVNLLTYIKRY